MGYFQLINAVDIWVCMDHASFINRGYMHRNKVRGDIPIRVPLIGASQNKNTREISIDLSCRDWNKVKKTLDLKYSEEPYFSIAKNLIDRASENDFQNLASFNFAMIKGIVDYLEIDTRLISSSIGLTSKIKSDGIIEIAKVFNGETYINAPGGIGLYDKEYFLKHNLRLQFLNPTLQGEFKDMSIFHLLSCYSKSETC